MENQMYAVVVSKKVRKRIDDLPVHMKVRVENKVASLAFDPIPDGAVKLSGFVSTYRIRVGDYRIIYSVDDELVIVRIENVDHRKDVYR